MIDEVRKVLDAFPGISYAVNQPIDMRVQEMIIGARGDVVVKVFGYAIGELNRLARQVEDAVQRHPGLLGCLRPAQRGHEVPAASRSTASPPAASG